MSGTFGYELDLCRLSQEEKEEIKEQIKTFHKYAALIQSGDMYRLGNPGQEEVAAWAFVSEDKSEVLLNLFILQTHGNMPVSYIRLSGLEEGRMYKEESSGKVYPANALMEAGIPILAPMGDFQAEQMYFRRVEESAGS